MNNYKNCGRFDFENPYIVTHTGKRFHVLQPSSREIKIKDISFALSNLCRFTGHIEFYSVAEHSILVQRIIKYHGGSVREQLWGLLHDAAEAYISDLNSPVKYSWGLAAYRVVEGEIRKAIGEFASVGEKYPEIVSWADGEAFKIEVERFFTKEIRINDFGILDDDIPDYAGRISFPNMTRHSARDRFLGLYLDLRRENDKEESNWPVEG
jgi:hypothetical protein